MFLEHYGLRDQPFGVTPDPRYLYFGATHREALASLYYGIETGCGFMTLIAPPGMGKTTLLLHLLDRVRNSAQTVFLFQTQCDSREFLRCLLTDLGIDAREQNLAHMHEALNSVLLSNARTGRRFVLVIDEAQNLGHSVLETVRLLSDFETTSAKLLQIVLSGQPQLADRLSHPDLLQLRQRISIVSRLQPFTRGGTVLYIDNRLHVAGYSGPPLFTFEAIAQIADHSGGIPRNINNICFSALTLGYAKGLKQIDATIVREVLADLNMDALGSESMTSGPAASVSHFSVGSLGPSDETSYLEFHAAQRVARAEGVESQKEPIHAESDPLQVVSDRESNPLAAVSQIETSAPAAADSLPGQKTGSPDGIVNSPGSPLSSPAVKLIPRMQDPQLPFNKARGEGEQSLTPAAVSDRATGTSPEGSPYELGATHFEDETPASFAHPTVTVATPEATGPADVQAAAPGTPGTKTAPYENQVHASKAPNRGVGTDFEQAPSAAALLSAAIAELAAASSSLHVSDALKTENPVQSSGAAESFRQPSPEESRSPAATSTLGSGQGNSRKSLGSRRASGIRAHGGKRSGLPKRWTLIAARAAVLFVVVGVGVLFLHHNPGVDGALSSTPAMAAQPATGDTASTSPAGCPTPAVTSSAPGPPIARPASTRPAAATRPAARSWLDTAAAFSNESAVCLRVPSSASTRELHPPSDNQHGPFPVGGRLKEPRLLSGVAPEYPSVARREHVEGDVIVEIVVDEGGNISDMTAVSGPMVLRRAALSAIDRWKYEPPKLDGQPVSVQATVTLQFRL